MIYLLHGENTAASYVRFLQIIETYPNHAKTYLNIASPGQDIIAQILNLSLFDKQKLIIVEDFFANFKKPPLDLIATIPTDAILIFLEHSKLTTQQLAKLPAQIKVELFKPDPQIFKFLDNFSPNRHETIRAFNRISHDQPGLLYQLENRFFQLILVKLGIDQKTASLICQKQIYEWQWQKIKRTAQIFSTNKLLNLFKACLKIESLVKSNQTNLPPRTLLILAFDKYL